MPTILSRRRSVYRVGIHHLKVTVSNMSYHVLGLCGALDTVSFLDVIFGDLGPRGRVHVLGLFDICNAKSF